MDMVRKRKRLTEPEAQFYMAQLLDGMVYMHGKNVIHRDLKLGNIFLDSHMNLKIADFGLAAQILYDGERKKTICGTPNYIAPEILSGKAGHSFEVDIWAAGVIMYTLLVGKPPFETTDVKLTYRKIKANSYTFPDRMVGRDARDLITKILHPSPDNRPTLPHMQRHSFFTKGGVPKSIPSSALYSVPVFDNRSAKSESARDYHRSGSGALRTLPANSYPKSARTATVKPSVPGYDRVAQPKSTETAKASTRPRTERGHAKKDDVDNDMDVQRAHDQLQQSIARLPQGTMAQTAPISTAQSTKAMTGVDPIIDNLNKLKLDTGAGAKASSRPGTAPQTHSSGGARSTDATAPDTWVSKWVDYSSKYGLGYLLCDQHIGVVFNDSTKIVLHPDGSRVEYVERRRVGGGGSYDDKRSFQLTSHPSELTKKVTLLKHFKNYLLEHTSSQPESKPSSSHSSAIYVKKWLRTRHAFIFRLSNKTIQVHFHDHTEIILSSEARVVTYMDKRGNRSTYPLVSIPPQQVTRHSSPSSRQGVVHDRVNRVAFGALAPLNCDCCCRTW
jgi:polo-like kinase 1